MTLYETDAQPQSKEKHTLKQCEVVLVPGKAEKCVLD